MAGKQSIWKKEISLRRRKPAELVESPRSPGIAVPARAPGPERPESVAELLRPVELRPVELRPVPVSPPEPLFPESEVELGPDASVEEPEAELEPEPAPTVIAVLPAPPVAPKLVPVAVPAPPAETFVFPVEPQPQPEPEPEPEPKAEPTLQRRERKRLANEVEAERKRIEVQRKLVAQRRKRSEKGVKRRKQLVGLSIGSSQIVAARVANKGRPKLLRIGREPLERGVVVAGELREADELADALRRLFRRNKLPTRAVRLGIGNGRVGMRIFELTGIDDPKQLDNAVRFRAQETLPIPLEDAVLDYRILDEQVNQEGQIVRKVLLVVAHREPVERFVGACRKAGVKLVGIDLEAFGLLRALAEEPTTDNSGSVVCSIGYDRTIVAVSNGETCEFTRVLDWGGFSLDVAVARAIDVTPTEAEPLRTRLSLLEQDGVQGLDPAVVARARQGVRSELQSFARDLVASLRLYQEQPGSLGIGEIVLSGGASLLEGLPEELEGLIGVSVRLGDPLARLKLARKVRSRAVAESAVLAGAIGLGIEG